jgi:hypothetical protein
MDGLAFRSIPYQIAVSLMKWELVVPFLSTTVKDILFCFHDRAENPMSHKYVVTAGSKTFAALSQKSGKSSFTSSQN